MNILGFYGIIKTYFGKIAVFCLCFILIYRNNIERRRKAGQEPGMACRWGIGVNRFEEAFSADGLGSGRPIVHRFSRSHRAANRCMGGFDGADNGLSKFAHGRRPVLFRPFDHAKGHGSHHPRRFPGRMGQSAVGLRPGGVLQQGIFDGGWQPFHRYIRGLGDGRYSGHHGKPQRAQRVGTSYGIVTTLAEGASVTILDSSHATWAKVRTASGLEGTA